MGLGVARYEQLVSGQLGNGQLADRPGSDDQGANNQRGSRMSLAPKPHLAVTRLMLTSFRSYSHAELRTGLEPVVLTGENGAGKTNVLEALSFLMPGRGLRGARLGDVTRIGAPAGWAVSATISSPDGEVLVGTGIGGAGAGGIGDDSEDGGAERRIVRINGEPAGGPAALAEYMRMVWLTPQMDGLFLDSGSARRRFLDRLTSAFHTGHGYQLNAYERVMRERNKLLAEGRMDPAWLGALEARMAEHGTALAAARIDTLAQLRAALLMTEGAFPAANLALKGGLEEALLQRPAVAVEDEYKERLKALRRVDAQAGRATEGPHRSDLEAEHKPKAMPAALCSTGEQKALLIGMTLASARMIAAQTGAAPVLLLDEVAAHLDAERRAALYDEICVLGAQAWLTGADSSLFEALEGRARFFSVAQGSIVPSHQ